MGGIENVKNCSKSNDIDTCLGKKATLFCDMHVQCDHAWVFKQLKTEMKMTFESLTVKHVQLFKI